MLIAHFADTHLGFKLYGLSWTLDEILDHFRAAVEKAVAEHVDAVLFSGDTFDYWKPPNRVVKFFMDTLKPLIDRGVRVYAVLGEHDTPKRRDLPVHELVPGVKLLGTRPDRFRDCFIVDGEEYCVAGVSNIRLSYGEGMRRKLRERINKALAGTAGRKTILMLHQNISNFFTFEPGLDLGEIPRSPVYVAMGHLHRRIIHSREGQIIAYPGSLDILNVDEVDVYRESGKGFYLVDLSGDEPRVEKVDTPVLAVDKLACELRELESSVRRKAAELPGDRNSVLVIELTLNADEKAKADVLISRLRKTLPKRIYLRIKPIYKDLRIDYRTSTTDTAQLEIDVIAERLGGEKYRELARKIKRLKDLALAEDWDAVREQLEEIVNDPYWSRYIHSTPITLPQVKLGPEERNTGGTISSTGKPGPTRMRDLLSFLGGGH